MDWAGGSTGSSDAGGLLGQLTYSAYTEASYDDVWENYAWHQPLPWWFPLDFGKVNSSRAWDHEEHVPVSFALLCTLLSLKCCCTKCLLQLGCVQLTPPAFPHTCSI